MSAAPSPAPAAGRRGQAPAGADRGAHILRRADDPRVRLDDFDNPSPRLRLQFPCIADATTTRGFAALERALPEAWTEAVRRAWSSLPVPGPDTPLQEVLARGTSRILPDDPAAVKMIAARRSALGRLCDHLPSLPLRDVDSRGLERLVHAYRHARRTASAAVTSADLTELRRTVEQARVSAGLPPIRGSRDTRPRRRQGRATHRPVAGLDEVDRLLQTTTGWMQGLVLLRVVTTVPDAALRRLRRQDFDLDAGLLRVHLGATRQPGGPEGRLCFGLPRWCVAQLRVSFAGLDGWDGARLLFPAKGAPHRPRREVSHAFRLAADACGCSDTTLRSLRRLAQSIHRTAPRAVRRSTATTRLDGDTLVGSSARRPVAEAQNAYAEWVTAAWTALHQPPMPLAGVSKRAPAGVAPEAPERRQRVAQEAPPGAVVSGCRVPPAGHERRGSTPRTVDTSPWKAAHAAPLSATTRDPAPPAVRVPGPAEAILQMQLVDSAMRAAEMAHNRAVRAEAELRKLRADAAEPDKQLLFTIFVAGGGFASGMAFKDWLDSSPNFEALLSRCKAEVGRLFAAMAEPLAAEMLRTGAPGSG